MPILLKSSADIARMREAGRVAAAVAAAMRAAARAGVTTATLDQLAAGEIARLGAMSAVAKAAGGRFPGQTCISVNEQVLHGVPGPRALRDGDIVTFDVSVMLNGFCASRAVTVPVGAAASPERQRVIDVAECALARAIELVRPMRKWSEVARQVQRQIEARGCQVVREFVGHGIGRRQFEEPKVFNHVDAVTLRGDFPLRAGMTLTIEPIVTAGRREVDLLADGWTVATMDGQPAAHVRHTVAVTDQEAEVLTAG